MIDIANKIDEWTAEQYSGLTKKLFGYCELMRKTTGTPAGEQVFPVKIIDGKADRGSNQISLDDRYQLITWSRMAGNINRVEHEDEGWGIRNSTRKTGTLRWVIAHKVELGENFINELLRVFPDRLTIEGYELVFIDNDISLDTDHEGVYEEELGKTVYEKHRFNWNIYAVELNVEFKLCEPA